MSQVRIRTSVPSKAAAGEVIELKTLIKHPMDNGFMYSSDGERIPRRIIHRFEAQFNGETVFAADWHEAVSSNPFISFFVLVKESGRFEFKWYDDDGSVYTDAAELQVV
ncbi:MAG: thiosulfate oxidation carrier complex protein SoxZ [Albidovulum sp.]|nr:thiosulfate oxidation carrier complex protein SoxZ [Albidovulum sp.]MDE0306686.1 thiosulfate oxidation carrier complex protein SoxZ [Albidovulum sp.]MDE0532667.1 thiosulfate oxidation carrier complex protein SoxZ [Albidovulum sp.]